MSNGQMLALAPVNKIALILPVDTTNDLAVDLYKIARFYDIPRAVIILANDIQSLIIKWDVVPEWLRGVIRMCPALRTSLAVSARKFESCRRRYDFFFFVFAFLGGK